MIGLGMVGKDAHKESGCFRCGYRLRILSWFIREGIYRTNPAVFWYP